MLFNFSDNDQHIIDAINKASKQEPTYRLKSIYIGVYSKQDQKHIESIRHKFTCHDVNLFDAKTVKIWR